MNPQIPQYNPYQKVGPYKFNQAYDATKSNEANTYLQVYSEWVYLHGSDTVYIQMQFNKAEEVFGEFLYKTISNGTPMRLFIEEVEGWGGMGDMYTKFGLSTQDECTLYCPKILFEQAKPGLLPRQGDLVYIEKSKKLFEIMHVEDECPPSFYLLENKVSFKINCKTYSYDHSEISNDVSLPAEVIALDNIFKNINNNDINLHNEEINRNNKPIKDETLSKQLVDKTEIDPLAKGS